MHVANDDAAYLLDAWTLHDGVDASLHVARHGSMATDRVGSRRVDPDRDASNELDLVLLEIEVGLGLVQMQHATQ